MEGCTLCPRQCGADRRRSAGRCGATDAMEVARVCVHTGEEPPLVGPDGRGIVNVFFAHCNLGCIYCQNYQISGRTAVGGEPMDAARLADEVARLLPQSAGLVGFVTAAHYADRVPLVVDELHRRGLFPTVVYNSGGYESVATLRRLEGVVDVYLPDFKYASAPLAARYSQAPDYPEVASAAIGEMMRQVGCGLKQADGVAFRGLIVRHLVLPGHVDNSLQCLEWLASQADPSRLHLSLMAQYYPPHDGLPEPLNRNVGREEYEAVVARYVELGFGEGWIQELEANASYRPDFSVAQHPFAEEGGCA